MKLSEVVKEMLATLDPTIGDEVLAERLEGKLSEADYRELTYPLLVNEIRRLRRDTTRHIEWTQLPFNPATNLAIVAEAAQGRVVDPTADRAAWLRERILVPGREPTTWGEATVEDHEARIEYLDRMRRGIGYTIERHRDAIERLRGADARCLADLYQMAA